MEWKGTGDTRWFAAHGRVHQANDCDTSQGVRAYMQQSRIFVGMVLILIFGEVLGLYGCVVHSQSLQSISLQPMRHSPLT